jgi:HPt (histidine-containing phosphotransfer) domain-containing protein
VETGSLCNMHRILNIPADLALEAAPAAVLQSFDPDQLQHLLDLVGPQVAPTLLAHLDTDLTACQSSLQRGLDEADWSTLRDASHVLIALAGSVGAQSLHAMAQDVNAAAHRQDRAAISAAKPRLLAELQALIALVALTRAQIAGPP